MRSRPGEAPFGRTPAVPSADTSAGSTSPFLSPQTGSCSAPARIGRSTPATDEADAAEVGVERRPAADRPPKALERGERILVDAWFRIHRLAGEMEARPLDCDDRVELLVEDAADDAEQRSPQARPAGGARGEHDAPVFEGKRRSHHARHSPTRLECAADEIGLAEHAVQMQIEPG